MSMTYVGYVAEKICQIAIHMSVLVRYVVICQIFKIFMGAYFPDERETVGDGECGGRASG